ncbi:ubiquinone/menaquinone biosynthesis methyltransferase [Litchfieldella qijiaojingensis]|uniref:Ubiquinone/menaquinone biosynthesis methyltransferase n=1 Tax=Litchfieldella qijiaojingensis TaxID=980347 RepID=A0ABQ2Z694_9GAMM|nr:methyltransferase domain-containing protein [Halomonas qijiaojingensis]GGY04858.1 ubiquinone/menaquinone biosynthesis methyltransferase [Halomonas qijiaojingensis]
MNEMATQRVSDSPAEVYEARFVPALFQQWGDVLADMAGIGPGQRVLDVACGTGVAARAAAGRVGPRGSVVGVDPNPEMLAVARRVSPAIDWHQGRAESLPFPEAGFDSVVSQFGLMFFDDRAAGLREMLRMLRPGGRLAVAVCDALDHSPGYAVFAELLQRLFGASVADAFRAPFVLGDRETLLELCAAAGIADAEVTQRDGRVRFASIADLVATEQACAWTLGGLLDQDQFARLDREARVSLRPFTTPNGDVEFNMPALVITAVKP